MAVAAAAGRPWCPPTRDLQHKHAAGIAFWTILAETLRIPFSSTTKSSGSRIGFPHSGLTLWNGNAVYLRSESQTWQTPLQWLRILPMHWKINTFSSPTADAAGSVRSVSHSFCPQKGKTWRDEESAIRKGCRAYIPLRIYWSCRDRWVRWRRRSSGRGPLVGHPRSHHSCAASSRPIAVVSEFNSSFQEFSALSIILLH